MKSKNFIGVKTTKIYCVPSCPARKELMRLHGVGKWTAEYVSLRCLKDPAALPVDDVGLQNAVKQQLGLRKKPTADAISTFSARWNNWQAYATFYLWASLI